MVYTLPPRESGLGSALGQAIGATAGNEFGYQRQYGREEKEYQRTRGRIHEGLKSLENLPPKTSPAKLATALFQATAGIPGAERYVGQIFPLLLQQMQANASQNVNYPGEEQNFNQQNQPARQALPEFGQGTNLNKTGNNKFGPTNIPGNEPPGNLPQEATSGIKRPVYDAQTLIDQSKKLSRERTAQNIPTTVKEAYQEVKEINDENKIYNHEIENERKNRVVTQKEYGQKAEEKLLKLMPDATDEQKAIFRKMGEVEAGQDKSEADIDKFLAKEATNFKNKIANIKSDLSAPRTSNTFHRKFLGTDKDFNQASADLRLKLKPILDLGLYDTSRKLLDDLGYYPEERESIINPLDDRTKSIIKLTPDAQKTEIKAKSNIQFPLHGSKNIKERFEKVRKIDPQTQMTNVVNSLKEVLKTNPNASLVLVRKAFEDKGYDWRLFKDAFNIISELPEDKGGIKLNDDQFNQIKYLDSPPLNSLEKILHGFKLIGR